MSVARRGLALRVDSEDPKSSLKNAVIFSKPYQEDKLFDDKENVKSGIGSGKPSSKLSVYKDPTASVCSQCGVDRLRIIISGCDKVTACTQTDDSFPNLQDWLCSEKPPVEYWMELAEQRRVALKETLAENKELCDLVESLNAEIGRLQLIADKAGQFSRFYQEANSLEPQDNVTD